MFNLSAENDVVRNVYHEPSTQVGVFVPVIK